MFAAARVTIYHVERVDIGACLALPIEAKQDASKALVGVEPITSSPSYLDSVQFHLELAKYRTCRVNANDGAAA